MSTQTEMAFMQEGGLRDDGATRDPVSGNEVPSGSMDQEVRDDIPAQLSEGEYVVPADVVRYFGVKFFEDLRAEAKRGLTRMEQDGRIGGEPASPSEPMPSEGQEEEDEDDFPFDISELRTRQVNVGGLMTGYQEGGDVIRAGSALSDAAEIADKEVEQSIIKYVKYTNGSNIIYIRFMGGQPLDVIPMGYLPMEGQTVPDPTVPEEPVEEKEKEFTTQEKVEERFGRDDSEVKPYRQLRDTPYDPKATGSARGLGVTGDLDYMPTGYENYTSQDWIKAGNSYDNSLAKVAKFLPGGNIVASMTSTAGRKAIDKILNSPNADIKPSDRTAMELFKLQTDNIEEANLSDLNPLKMFSNLFQSEDDITKTVSDNDNDKKIKELMDKYTNQLTLERGEFEGKHKFKGTEYAARDFYSQGSMELQGLGTDGEQSGRVFFQPSNMGRANDKFRYNIGGFKNVYMSRKELNKYFGFPPNHDLTPEQIASFDPLTASKQSVAGSEIDNMLGINREEYVAPTPKSDILTADDVTAKYGDVTAGLGGSALKDLPKPKPIKIVQPKEKDKEKYIPPKKKKKPYDAKKEMDRFRADQAKFKKAGLDEGAAKGEAASAARYAGLAKAYGKNKGGLVSRRKSKKKT